MFQGHFFIILACTSVIFGASYPLLDRKQERLSREKYKYINVICLGQTRPAPTTMSQSPVFVSSYVHL